MIQQSTDALLWQILQIKCFDSQKNQELSFQSDDDIGLAVIQKIIQVFDKYDVNIQLVEDHMV